MRSLRTLFSVKLSSRILRSSLVWLVALCLPALLILWINGQFSVHAQASDGTPSPRISSEVAWTLETVKLASGGDPFRGLLLARRCGHCHGAEGFSSEPAVPNLAGLDRLSLWKQLQDFRSGKRRSPVMEPIAALLTTQDAADVGAYFSMLPTFADPQDNRSFPQAIADRARLPVARKLVAFGDGSRGIPPCQACHGPVALAKGAPPLSTQNAKYILNQLGRFAERTRSNDINVAMREIAGRLTAEERAALSNYYGAGEAATNPNSGTAISP